MFYYLILASVVSQLIAIKDLVLIGAWSFAASAGVLMAGGIEPVIALLFRAWSVDLEKPSEVSATNQP